MEMDRKILEKEFHDKLRRVHDDHHTADTRWSSALEATIKSNPLWSNMKYYAVERKSRALVQDWYQEHCKGKSVLDYCCGNGEDGLFIAQSGARQVIGIDISDISIENCQKAAKENNLDTIVTYLIRDAEHTGFEDNSFDIITEYGALHHLNLEKAFAEMARILNPDGKIICTEALGHNSVINLYRKLTPHLRTEWEAEHILKKDDFTIARKYFAEIEFYFFHLATVLAVPFRNLSIFPTILKILENMDEFMLKIPGLKWQAWQIVFILKEPIKNKAY